MKPSFQIEIPSELRPLLGEQDPGTRIFRNFGDQAHYAEWFDAIVKHVGPTLSPGGVAGFVHVSRVAVHKRIKAGKLTAFMFYAPENNERLPIYLRLFRDPANPYMYIPYEECVAWAKELSERGTGSSAVPSPGADDFDEQTLLEPPEAMKKQIRSIKKKRSSKR